MCCNKEKGSADSSVAADMLQHREEEEEKDCHNCCNKHLAPLSLCHINITLSHQIQKKAAGTQRDIPTKI